MRLSPMSIDYSNVFKESFFARPTLSVAPELLGSILCRRFPDGEISCASIVEVEAYTEDDPACHAFGGRTKRCEVMFGKAGLAYVYFIYGMYNCLNVVTEREGTPGAVLIRALDMDGGNGPGRLCKSLHIDRSHNAVNLMDAAGPIWLARGTSPAEGMIGKSARVGISSAQERLWRFFIIDHPCLSVKKVRPKQAGKKSM